jgi:hypothetical protein
MALAYSHSHGMWLSIDSVVERTTEILWEVLLLLALPNWMQHVARMAKPALAGTTYWIGISNYGNNRSMTKVPMSKRSTVDLFRRFRIHDSDLRFRPLVKRDAFR